MHSGKEDCGAFQRPVGANPCNLWFKKKFCAPCGRIYKLKKLTTMAKFKFVNRKNPVHKDQPGKWYATPATTQRLSTKAVCKSVSRHTTAAPTELELTFNLVCEDIPAQLQLGHSVQLGSLGWLRLSFGSTGVDNIQDFDPSMIKNIKIVFTPSKELMANVKQGLSFENAGVVEAGFTFPTTKAYQEYKKTGKLPAPGGQAGEGGGDEELPLG